MAGYQPEYKRTATEMYKGHKIETVFYRPDIGLQVDGESLGGFYTSTAVALKAGRHHIDEVIKAEKKEQ